MNTIAMFSGQDMLIIFLIVLILFGAKKLPELAKGMGQAVKEFNKAKDEIHSELSKTEERVTVQPAPNKLEYNPNAAAAPTAAAQPQQTNVPPAPPVTPA